MKSWGWAALAALALSGLSPVLAAERQVDLLANDASLADVAKALSEQTGRTIEVADAVRATKVSLRLQDVPLELALQLVADVSGLTVLQKGDAYRLAPGGAAAGGGWQALRVVTPDLPEPDRRQLEKVRVQCARVAPSQLAGYFGSPGVRRTETGLVLCAAEIPAPARGAALLPPAGDQIKPERVQAAWDEATRRFAERWSRPPAETLVPHHTHTALQPPEGMLAIIGFDPTSTLVGVGRPAAVKAFAALAAELDVAPQTVHLEARLAALPANAALTWQKLPVADGKATLAVALAPAETAMALTAGGATTTVAVDNARAAVLGLGRAFTQTGSVDECLELPGAPVVDLVTTLSDLLVVPWSAVDDGRPVVRLMLHPHGGQVLAEVPGREPGRASIDSQAPELFCTVTVPEGQVLLLGGLEPVGPFRAPDACRLLAQLPLLGTLYRLPDDRATPPATLIAIQPRVAR